MDKYTFFYWFLVYGKGTKIALFIDSSLRSEFPVVMSVTISAKKNDVRFVFTTSCLYEGPCLIYVICVCLRIVVSNTYLCCIFVLFFFVVCTFMLPVSLDCSFLIFPSVLSNV